MLEELGTRNLVAQAVSDDPSTWIFERLGVARRASGAAAHRVVASHDRGRTRQDGVGLQHVDAALHMVESNVTNADALTRQAMSWNASAIASS